MLNHWSFTTIGAELSTVDSNGHLDMVAINW
jgi:hypothetical protein